MWNLTTTLSATMDVSCHSPTPMPYCVRLIEREPWNTNELPSRVTLTGAVTA